MEGARADRVNRFIGVSGSGRGEHAIWVAARGQARLFLAPRPADHHAAGVSLVSAKTDCVQS
jgi:hypothetical protein